MGRRSVRLLPVELTPVASVLDVGCGVRPADFIECDRYVGIEAHRPYVEALALREVICSDWRPALRRFADGEFALVLGLDFVEHLTREDGTAFIAEAQRVGERVAIFTPLGHFPQAYGDGETDQWGMDGGWWQRHRSAWMPEDFTGWQTYTLARFHRRDAKGRRLPTPIDAFWAVSR